MKNISSILSIITVIIIFGISMISLWKTKPSWVQNDKKELDWGLVSAYSILFAFLVGSVTLIIGLQFYALKQRKRENPYTIK